MDTDCNCKKGGHCERSPVCIKGQVILPNKVFDHPLISSSLEISRA